MKLYQEVTRGVEYPLHTYWMSPDRTSIGGYIPVGGPLKVFSKPMTFVARGRKFVEVSAPRMGAKVKAEVARMTELMAPKAEKSPPSGSETRTVPGSSGKVYTLTKSSGRWTCNCPGYLYRRSCKHSEAVLA